MCSVCCVTCYMYIIVVKWALVICLIGIPKAIGLKAYISGKSQVPMVQLIGNIFLANCAQVKISIELQQLYL